MQEEGAETTSHNRHQEAARGGLFFPLQVDARNVPSYVLKIGRRQHLPLENIARLSVNLGVRYVPIDSISLGVMRQPRTAASTTHL